LGDGAGAVLFEPNYEGLGLQDEYLKWRCRSWFLIDAGGSLHPLLKTTEENKNRHNIVQDGKTVFKYAVYNMASDEKEII
jgi:3-oxoacyl-[acyl-carrier-protein] synthase-3